MKSLILFTATMFASACAQMPGGDGDPNDGAGEETADGTGESTGSGPQPPRLGLHLTDAPGDFDEVWVNIVSVEIESPELGWLPLTDSPQAYDLLTLQNDVTAAMGNTALEPGAYGQLRLIVDDAFVVADGVSEELKIASGNQTGIKINLDATLEENMVYTLVIDFDADKSVKSTGQGWLMTPVIKVKSFDGQPVPEPEAEEPEAEEPEAEEPEAGDETDDNSVD
jgi:hypothetical protein